MCELDNILTTQILREWNLATHFIAELACFKPKIKLKMEKIKKTSHLPAGITTSTVFVASTTPDPLQDMQCSWRERQYISMFVSSDGEITTEASK